MKILKLVAVLAAAALCCASASANVTYNVNRTVDAATVTGVIVTDGHIGPLTPANFVSWDLTLSDATNSSHLKADNQLSIGSDLTLLGPILTATADHILLTDLSLPAKNFDILNGGFWQIVGTGQPGQGGDEFVFIPNSHIKYHVHLGGGLLPLAINAANPVPLPAAAWLFGAALSSLGFARRRT